MYVGPYENVVRTVFTLSVFFFFTLSVDERFYIIGKFFLHYRFKEVFTLSVIFFYIIGCFYIIGNFFYIIGRFYIIG